MNGFLSDVAGVLLRKPCLMVLWPAKAASPGRLLFGRRRANAEQVVFAADEKLSLRNRGGREAGFVECILSDDVEFIGEVDETGKAEFFSGAAALLFPIDWPEPFGLVAIEAMAFGVPVIAWREGSMPEVVDDGETGFLVLVFCFRA